MTPLGNQLSHGRHLRIADNRNPDRYLYRMKAYSVTEAKARLGALADMALKKGPIYIRRGQRILQLVEATPNEAIPLHTEGHFAVVAERAAYLNSLPIDSEPLNRSILYSARRKGRARTLAG